MTTRIHALAAIAVLIACACGSAALSGPITVSDAWARAAVAAPAASPMTGMSGPATSNTGAYMTIENSADVPDRLVAVKTTAAAAAELHTASMVNGVMEMRPVAAIDVPAKGSVALKPGGFHVMLIGLTGDLAAGSMVKLTLTFEKAGAVTVEATVRTEAP